MLNKKRDRKLKLCPYTGLKKNCSPDCMLYKEGIRVNEKTGEQFPVADCTHNLIAENIEAMHNRIFMLQKEVGDTKNVVGLGLLQSVGMVQTADLIRQAENILHKSDNLPDAALQIVSPDQKRIEDKPEDEGNKS